MVVVIDRRIKRVFLENKAQYIGSVLLIAFSCFLFANLVLVGSNLTRLMDEYEKDYAQEDASFITDDNIVDPREFELAADAVIEEGRTFDYALSKGITLRLFTKNDKVNLPAVFEGRELSGKGGILINPAFAAAHGYKIGDTLTISDKRFTVAGFVGIPNYIYPLKTETDILYSPQNFGIAVIDREDFKGLGEGNSFYAVKFNHGEGNLRVRSMEFMELLKKRGIDVVQWTDIGINMRVKGVAAKLDSAGLMGRAVPTVVLLLTAILLSNVIGRLIKGESVIIGALYALGYKRKDLYRHYLKFPLVIALIGGFLGTASGLFFVSPMLSFYLELFDIPMTGIGYSPAVIIISLLLPLVFLGIGGWLVARKELRYSPAELMKGDREKGRVNFLERRLKLDKLKFGLKFKVREQLRSLPRLALLLAGCAIATLFLLFGFFLKSGMDYFLKTEVKNAQNYRYEYVFEKLRTEPAPVGSEPFAVSKFQLESGDDKVFNVAGVLPDSRISKVMDESGKKLNLDQVVITKPIADKLKAKPGDTITIIRRTDYQEFSLKVGGVADAFNMAVFMPLAEYNEKFGMPEGSYNELFSNKLLDIPENDAYRILSIQDKITGVKKLMAPLVSLVVFVSAVAFFIGIIIIYVVTSMIIDENKNTISLMKVFGYRKKEVNSLVLNSSTIVVAVGYILGILFSFLAMGGWMKAIENSAPFAMPVIIDPLYIVVGFAVVMFSYELSKLLSSKKVNAISMGEALKGGAE